MNGKGKALFLCLGALLGILLGAVLSKGLYLIGTLGNPIAIYGAAAFFRVEPEEFSFFGACLGLTLGWLAAARMTGRKAGETLDLIAVPGALLIAALRFGTLYWGEIGLGEFQTLGIQNVGEGGFPAFFPLAVQDSWGDWWLAVGTLEAFFALICALIALGVRNRYAVQPGRLFERTSLAICAGQVFFELLHTAGTVTYFVHTEQLWCALYILIRVIANSRTAARAGYGPKAWLAVLQAVLWIALNGVLQFVIDKPYGFLALLPESAGDWVSDRLAPLGYGLIALSCAGLGWVALRASQRAWTATRGKDGRWEKA